MKKLIGLLTVAVLMISLLAACGSNAQNEQPKQTTGAGKQETLQTTAATQPPKTSAPEQGTTQTVPNTTGTTPAASVPAASGNEAQITEEQAKQIALDHAGFTADEVTYLRVTFDHDDGRAEYEVEFDKDRWDYEYEIDAKTGEIISWDKDT